MCNTHHKNWHENVIKILQAIAIIYTLYTL